MSKLIKRSKFLLAIVLLSVCFATAYAAVGDNQLALTTMPSSASSNDPLVSVHSLDPSKLFSASSPLESAAFGAVSRQAMPMTPTQIHRLKQMMAVTQKAASAPAGLPPKPVTSSIMVSLSPGTTPPVISLQQGFVSSLVFVDEAGHKWPIEGYDLGNPNAFNIQWQQGSNILLVQASSMYTYGNIAVKLKGLLTPVMLTLIPGQRQVDYRVDLHIQGEAPGVHVGMGSGLPPQASSALLSVLNGIAPSKAKTLSVTGRGCSAALNNCQAWMSQHKLYLRIPMQILSPSWLSQMQSSDGMQAYELEKTPSVLVSYYGKTEQLKINGF